MKAALLAVLLSLGPRGFTHPRAPKPHPVAADDTHEIWYWVEDHQEIVLPLAGLLVLVTVVVAIRRGMKSGHDELHVKEEQKENIIRMMRSKLLVSPESVSLELHIDHFKAAALLEELVKEGKLVTQRVAGGVANYRLKGF